MKIIRELLDLYRRSVEAKERMAQAAIAALPSGPPDGALLPTDKRLPCPGCGSILPAAPADYRDVQQMLAEWRAMR